ncbi:MAG: hypothetical protein LBF25_02520 [Puniceicoccales bacterium]|jgi:hypothetical protein|nr:hypothetical protein [Puniceicoccales bacterium]
MGLWHLSPCTDVGFKHVLKEKSRAIRFVTFFCKLLDGLGSPLCRMLDSTRILENRKVSQVEVIPESIGYKGEVVTKKTNDGEKNEPPKDSESKGGGLPKHPKIDSGFVVNPSDSSGRDLFKMGIEMQVRDEGNMPARAVDYGMRIFRYKGESKNLGSKHKVFELSLNRWGLTNAPYKLLSISGKEGAECDGS